MALDRPAIDEGAHGAELVGDLVDILARTRAQAEVMQADPVRNEPRLVVFVRAALDADRRAAADMVEEVVPS
jgi:hypothetical protein